MKVYELLSDPKNWTKGVEARDAHGVGVNAFNDQACCWCLYGAVMKVYWDLPGELTQALDRLYDTEACKDSVILWNDAHDRTHAEVVALCKELDI